MLCDLEIILIVHKESKSAHGAKAAGARALQTIEVSDGHTVRRLPRIDYFVPRSNRNTAIDRDYKPSSELIASSQSIRE